MPKCDFNKNYFLLKAPLNGCFCTNPKCSGKTKMLQENERSKYQAKKTTGKILYKNSHSEVLLGKSDFY